MGDPTEKQVPPLGLNSSVGMTTTEKILLAVMTVQY